MNLKTDQKRIFFWAIIVLFAMTLFQNSPQLLDNLFSKNVKFSKLANNSYSASISSLHNDEYLISLGRPRAHCDIYKDDKIIFKGKSSIFDKRTSLLASAGFSKDSETKLIKVDCDQYQSGFVPRLSFEPTIYNYTTGMIIHLYRSAIDMFIGPFSSILLLIASMINFYLADESQKKLAKKFIFYGVVALIYSMSLSYYTRLFMNGMSSSETHVYLRIIYSIAFNMLLQTSRANRFFLYSSHCLAIVGLYFINSSESLEFYYRSIHVIMPICTLWTFIDLLQSQSKTRDIFFLQSITLSWAIAQFMDTIKLNTNIGFYAAPLYLMLISAFLIYRIYSTQKRDHQFQFLSTNLTKSLNTSSSIQNGLNSILVDLAAAIPFAKFSCYLDEFVLGTCEKQGHTYARICDIGYDGIERAGKIEISEQSPTATAIKTGEIILQTGLKDGLWFIIIPISNVLTINISQDQKCPSYLAFEVYEMLKKIIPVLSGVKKLLEANGYKLNSSLAKLRPTLGDGLHEYETGAIFLDIADYSKHTEYYGESYSNFISSIIFPSMIKYMSDYCVPEVVRGDEIYFVTTGLFQKSNETISKMTARSVQRLSSFLSSVAPDLCSANGFPNVEFRIGVTHGKGAIMVDDTQVRTSGDHINRAKRLQDAASKGEILSDSLSFNNDFAESLIALSKKTIVVKKNVIEAVRVGVRRAA